MLSIDDLIRTLLREEIEDLKRYLIELIGKQKHEEEARYLTRKQVSKYLNIGLSTVDYWTKTRKLTKLEVNGSVRFDKHNLDAAIQKGALSKFKKL